LAAAIVTALAIVPGSSSLAVSSSTTVTTTVLSATSLTNNCTNPAGYDFGLLAPGAASTTSTAAGMCSFTFGSNNNTAMLRMYQRDRGGAAMTGRSDASVTLQAGSGINRMFGVQGVAATPSTAWFSGSAGKIFKTTNSGTLWSSQVSGTTATLYGLYVASASVAYAVGGTGVMKRTIDGTNWGDSCTVACPFTAADSVKGTDGATTSDVWAVGSGGMIAHSTNADTAGTPTWTAQASGTANQLTSVKAVSTLTAYAVGNTNSIVETVDGGTNWFVLTGDKRQHAQRRRCGAVGWKRLHLYCVDRQSRARYSGNRLDGSGYDRVDYDCRRRHRSQHDPGGVGTDQGRRRDS